MATPLATPSTLIDQFLPDYQFVERHHRRVAAEPAIVLDAAAAYRPDSDRFYCAMIGLREAPMRLFAQGNRRTPFGIDDFTLLARDRDSLVYGLVGAFWQPTYGLRPIADSDAFRHYHGTDAAKLVLAFHVRPDGAGSTVLETETRIFCPTPATRIKFMPYWLLIRPVSGLIRQRILKAIGRQAESKDVADIAAI
ncbi:MAG: hypothetical protein WC816_01555 [Sphingomonas sp.]|jgi:hypothetical protein